MIKATTLYQILKLLLRKPKSSMAEPSSSTTPPLNKPLIFVSTPHPPNRPLTSWAELVLASKSISHCIIIEDQLIVLVIKDITWMAQIIKERIEKIVEGLGHQLWAQIKYWGH